MAPHAASRHSLARQLSGCADRLRPLPLSDTHLFRPLHPGRPIRFSGPHVFFGHPMCFSGVHHRLHTPPTLLSSLSGIVRLFPQPPKRFPLPDAPVFRPLHPGRPKRFRARTMQKGFPAALPPTLCTLPRSGFVIGFAVLRPNFCFAFYAWPADCPFKSNVVRCNCLPARLQNTVLHTGNLPLCMAIQRQRSAILAAKPLLNICMRPTWGRLQIPACNSMFHVKQRRMRAHRQHFCKA